MKTIELDVFGRFGESLGIKRIYAKDNNTQSINQWIKQYDDKKISQILGFMGNPAPDFQHNSQLYISQKRGIEHFNFFVLGANNVIISSIYFAVRHIILHTWINHNDQFLTPNKEWQEDSEFQSDCLAFTLFYGKNRITCKEGINHFIPFGEAEVGAKEAFSSSFMHDFIQGKIKCDSKTQDKIEAKGKQTKIESEDFYVKPLIPTAPLGFSTESQEVFAAGKELWRYYHFQEFKDSTNPYNANASLYDIKAYFQGFNDKGKMNPPQKAQDEHYKDLIGTLNATLKDLASKIEPKVYEYDFLRE